jgi:ADP-ribose pyrophosphatase
MMEFESIEKIHQGKFITRYDIHYRTVSGKAKTYEMISRNPDITGLKDMLEKKPHA